MAIFFPPPPPFMGGRQPHDNRPLNPDVEAVAVNDPPFAHRERTRRHAIIVAMAQPDPWTYSFQGASQVFTARKLAPDIAHVPVNDPPFEQRGRSVRVASIVSITQPDPWVYAFAGRRQPFEGRKLSPPILGVPADSPPFQYPGRGAHFAIIIGLAQPDPWTFNYPGGFQVFTPRKLPIDITAVPENDPPFNRSGAAGPHAAIIIGIAQPDPWTYSFQGRRQPFEPRKLAPDQIAVPEDNPPFMHGGRAAYTAEIISLAQPNPWSGTFTGWRQPYSQRKLPPPMLGVPIDNPPFLHFGRTPAYQSIVKSWEPPPPTYLRSLYDRSHVIQIRRVTGRGFILTWGARAAPVNYPPVTFGGPVNAVMADIWSVMFASNWTYTFGGARQPYGKRVTVIN